MYRDKLIFYVILDKLQRFRYKLHKIWKKFNVKVFTNRTKIIYFKGDKPVSKEI